MLYDVMNNLWIRKDVLYNLFYTSIEVNSFLQRLTL